MTELVREVPLKLQEMVRTAYKALLQGSGGQPRRGQQQMIGVVARAAANAKRKGEKVTAAQFVVAQANPGTGKTFAYSLGAIPIALANDLKVIISVSTVALQEQLVQRDLVDVAKVVEGMKVALAKGRSRFVCAVKASEVVSKGGEDAAKAAVMLQRISSGEWDGDIDTAAASDKPASWSKMTNDRHGCAGKHCTSYSSCGYYKARAKIDQANVIVANHSLLVGDIAAGNVILPKFENCIVIVDEAHHLPEKALSSLSSGHAIQESLDWVNHGMSTMAMTRNAYRRGECERAALSAWNELSSLGAAIEDVRGAIRRLPQCNASRDPAKPIRFRAGHLPSTLVESGHACKEAAERAAAALKVVTDVIQSEEGESVGDKTRERLLAEAGRSLGRLQRMATVWGLMCTHELAGEPVAKWLTVADGDLSVAASPVGVGHYLYEQLWAKVAAAVHLSATLSTVGGFAPYLREVGLDKAGKVRAVEVQSPYRYKEQATLVIPADAPTAKNSKEHTEYLIKYIPKKLSSLPEGLGALMLFSSWAQLREVGDAMPEWVKSMMLSQGDMSRTEMLSKHAERIGKGRSSFLFGTAALEEGIDLRGKQCELVVVSKIPFDVPTDPVSETLKEHMETNGRCHFTEVVLPKACRRMAQAAGRLLRSESDKGEIVVADQRLASTRYGRSIIDSLPPYRLAG